MTQFKRFARMRGDEIVNIIETTREAVDGCVEVTGRSDAVVGSKYDAGSDTYSEPDADLRLVVKALVLIIKANLDKIVIPPSATAIWQRVKEDKL